MKLHIHTNTHILINSELERQKHCIVTTTAIRSHNNIFVNPVDLIHILKVANMWY